MGVRAQVLRRMGPVAAASVAAVVSLVVVDGPPAVATPAGYTLSVFAGTGSYGGATPGPAGVSDLTYPSGPAFNGAGDLLFAQGSPSAIVKITPQGALSIVAGNGSNGLAQNGPATASPMYPHGVAVDATGNLFIADTSNELIEKVTPDGQLRIIAGNGNGVTPPGNVFVPGPALSTNIGAISSVVVDRAGNVYAAFPNGHVVEKLDTHGHVGVFAGNGTSGATTGGTATAVSLATPEGLALGPDGSVYIVDDGNQVVSRVSPSGQLSLVAGNGTGGVATDGAIATATSLQDPVAIAVDPAGDLYVADAGNNRIEKIHDGVLHVLAGDGNTNPPTPGDALSSSITNPEAIVVDPRTGVVYANDEGSYQVVAIAPAGAAPAAVTGLTAAPGNTTAALTFTAPRWQPGAAVTGYQYSTDAGTTWRTLNTTTRAGAVTATVSGLINGRGYTFRVRARSTTGPGPASSGTTVTPAAPLALRLDLSVKVDTRLAGSRAGLRGGGLRPGSPFALQMHSRTVQIASGVADHHGTFNRSITMPGKTCVRGGLHRVTLTGIAPDGSLVRDTKWVLLDDTCHSHGTFTRRPSTATPVSSPLFGYGSARLTTGTQARLRAAASALHGARSVVITGYTQTDLTTPAARRANLILAHRRTLAVRAYLRRMGVQARIVTAARGAVDPVSTTHQELNRRVVISAAY